MDIVVHAEVSSVNNIWSITLGVVSNTVIDIYLLTSAHLVLSGDLSSGCVYAPCHLLDTQFLADVVRTDMWNIEQPKDAGTCRKKNTVKSCKWNTLKVPQMFADDREDSHDGQNNDHSRITRLCRFGWRQEAQV